MAFTTAGLRRLFFAGIVSLLPVAGLKAVTLVENPFEDDLKEIEKLKSDYDKTKNSKEKEKIEKKIETKEKVIEKKATSYTAPLLAKVKGIQNEIEALKKKNKDTSQKEAELKRLEEEIDRIEAWKKGESPAIPAKDDNGGGRKPDGKAKRGE